MIELAFGESSDGALKLAKTMKQGEYLKNAVAIFGGSKKEQHEAKKPRKWSGLTMEGSSKDVDALTLTLDIGDISDMNTGMNAHKKLLNDLYVDFSGVPDGIWKTNQQALNRIESKNRGQHRSLSEYGKTLNSTVQVKKVERIVNSCFIRTK